MNASALDTSILEEYRHPILFYVLATAIPWTLWYVAAHYSEQPRTDLTLALETGFGIAGLVAPTLVALALMLGNRRLRRDLIERTFHVGAVRPWHALLTCTLMLASILLAQAVSLLFGHSADQFRLAVHASFTAGLLPAWFMLILAPLLEEVAWHSYGTDCLRRRWNLLTTSLAFGVFWALWHAPLSMIKGYYHANVAATGLLYSANFALSLIPFVLLMNWLYYKTGRNLLVAIVFHITAGGFNEMFRSHPDSKVIQTGLLLVLVVWLVWRDPAFFLARVVGTDNGDRSR
jgi:uncharacterized protein